MPHFRSVLAAILISVAAPAVASADRLVTPPVSPPTFLTTGSELVAFNGYVYFAANDGVVGNELWRTDGTAAGTTLVADLRSDSPLASSNPRQFTVVGNRMFLVATTAVSSYAVFTIDGTGTPQATSVTGGVAGSQSTGGSMVGSVNGLGLLNHYDGQTNKLYGLGASGSVFTPIYAGADTAGTDVATVGGFAYYAQTNAGIGNSAYEPFRTNGVTTAVVKDIVPGVNGSQPGDFHATSNRAYFVADDGAHGRELWVTDGTSDGTQIVHEHHPLSTATSFGTPDQWAVNGDVLYYLPNDPTTGQEVWRTQGTDATTRVVKDITPGVGGQGVKIFPFKDGFGMLRGSDIWVSDGTEAGTTLLATVDGDGYGPMYPQTIGSRFYFRGGYSPFGSPLWRSDGTAAGTFALTAGPFDGNASATPDIGPPVPLGDKIIFTARYKHPAGDPVPTDARRIYVVDTAQADETRAATVAPSISGSPTVNSKLTGDKGSWTLEPNKYVYAWLRNGTVIPNATSTEHTVGPADAGAQLTFRVTASGIGGPNEVSATSAPVSIGGSQGGQSSTPNTPSTSSTPSTPAKPVTPALVVSKKAKLSGTARVGKTVKLTLPKLKQTKVKLTFSWYANGKVIKKQTKSSLKLTKRLKGKRITVKITLKKTGYKTLTITLGPTAKVKSA